MKKKINFVKSITAIASLLLLFVSCSKDDLAPTKDPDPIVKEFTSDHEKNLNLVYFIPKNNPAKVDYERRLSGVMLWLQNYYGKEMERNGYGYKTFGLLKNDVTKRVKITVIKGNLDKDSYGYDAGSGNVKTEVDAYFAAHPAERKGEHYLIILPGNDKSATDPNAVGVPFYGLGKYCFAKDLEILDMANAGQSEFVKWFGGMAHELGHGLNLPHNCQKVSENTNPALGMALMWAGNGTLTKSPTFLTAADCAILNTNQIFNKDTKAYYGAVTAKISKIDAKYENGNIVISGIFTTNVPVTDIIYYNDPNVNNEGTGVNHDYNATTWASKVTGENTFSVSMPVSELKYNTDYEYELKVKLIHNNGTITETTYPYKFVNSVPVIDFSTKPELSKTNWVVSDFSSQQTAAPAILVIDGKTDSAWHSQYSVAPAATYPHFITVDMKSVQEANGFSINNGGGRAVKDVEIWYSSNGTDFTLAGSYQPKKTSGIQYFNFASKLSFRYFKIAAKTSWDGTDFAQIQEVGLY
jgi:hypothetical protein